MTTRSKYPIGPLTILAVCVFVTATTPEEVPATERLSGFARRAAGRTAALKRPCISRSLPVARQRGGDDGFLGRG
jgi:hypothetical protein